MRLTELWSDPDGHKGKGKGDKRVILSHLCVRYLLFAPLSTNLSVFVCEYVGGRVPDKYLIPLCGK